MKDETFRRFALCVSDRYNRVGFAILCDLDGKFLVFRNARTRSMLERISFAADGPCAPIAADFIKNADKYRGEEFVRSFRLTDDDVRDILPMVKVDDYASFKQRDASAVTDRNLEWISCGESDLMISFEGYAREGAPRLRIGDYRNRNLTLPPFDKLRRWLMDRFDLWELPGANPDERAPRRSRAAKGGG